MDNEEIWKVADAEANRMVDEINALREENDRLKFQLSVTETTLQYVKEDFADAHAALILLKQYAEPTPGGHVINNAPMSIIDNALGDES